MKAARASTRIRSPQSNGGAPRLAPLPPGRHGIPPELVLANQRERLLSAATETFAGQGYAALSVRDVIQRARVSRATFYVIFDSKLDVVLAAQQHALEALEAAISAACAAQRDWPRALAAAVGAALDFASRFPAHARLLLASSHASPEPELARQGLALQERLLQLIREGAARCPSARHPEPLAEQAALGAALSIVANRFAAGEAASLPELRTDITRIILTPYLGENEAKHIAHVG
jgi:AcrR family transcriptional regulator